MKTFQTSMWNRQGNMIFLRECPNIKVLQWNTGKKANFAVEAGWKNSTYFYKIIPGTGPEAREKTIKLALSLIPQYKPELSK